MVYSDGKYLIADSARELQSFADKIGLPSEHLNGASFFPHYTVPDDFQKKVREAGVNEVSTEKLLEVAKKVYQPW